MQKREKRKKNPSPTQLCLKELRKRGFPCQVVEKYVRAPFLHGGGFRKDLWFGDLMALSATDTFLIQAGSETSHAEKVRNAIVHPEVMEWLSSPYRKYMIWTFAKRLVGKRGKWVSRISMIRKTDSGLESVPFQLS